MHCRTLNLDYWFWGNWFGKEDGYSNPIDCIELYLCDEMADFEIIEDQEEINIQDIKEFNEIRDLSEWSNKTLSDNQRIFNTKINEVIRGLKQLDKKIKENK